MNRMRFIVIHAAVLFLLTGVVDFGTIETAEARKTKIAQPGKVLIDHDVRRKELKSGDPDLCWVRSWDLPTSPIRPVKGVRTEDGELDPRYETPRDKMMELAVACLKSEGAPCQTIVDTMVAWAKAGAAINRTRKEADSYFEAALGVNLDMARPFIGAYAIARGTVPVSRKDDRRIQKWMKKVLKRSKKLMRGRIVRGRNYAAHNGAVASSGALMAYGAMWDDPRSFRHGIDQWNITLGDMRDDGSFPIEARRGARALMYTGRTLSGLMGIAEMARVQRINLYAQSPSKGKTIHKAVAFMVAAMHRNELIYPYAKENFYPGPNKDWRQQELRNLGSTLGWVVPYVARFPDHPNTKRIQSLRTDKDSDLGMEFDRVLELGIPVKGHWIGPRADCLYRAP